MVALTVGEVVLVPFPFSDLSQAKVRPAVCIGNAGRGDWILCQITSNTYGDSNAIATDSGDFLQGGLRVSSVARPAKLFTAHSGFVVRSVGKLHQSVLDKIRAALISILQSK